MSSPPKQIHEWPLELNAPQANDYIPWSQNSATGKLKFGSLLQALNNIYLQSSQAGEIIDDRVATLLVAGANIALTYNDQLNTLTISAATTGGGHTIQDEGTSLVGRSKLAFVGSTVNVVDDPSNDRTVVNISGSFGNFLNGGAITGAPTQTTIVFSQIPGSGGVPPYTYAWYRATVPNFILDGATLLSGVTTAIFNDTGLNPQTFYYYRRIVSDQIGNKQATEEVAISTLGGGGGA
jgi:hypothetical protein